MRPDTEPNIHTQRIMVGAFALTVVFGVAKLIAWIYNNLPTLGFGIAIIVFATVACYAIGIIVMEVTP